MSGTICPVCFSASSGISDDLENDRYHVRCPRCGHFSLVRTAEPALRAESDQNEMGRPRLGKSGGRKRANASAWLRENQDRDWSERPIISDEIEKLACLVTPTVLERADLLLLALNRRTEAVGEVHNLQDPWWWAASWCLNAHETVSLARLAESLEWIEAVGISQTSFHVLISAGGWQRLEELHQGRSGSGQGFVAMSFGEDLRAAYDNALAPGITAAGYRPHRVDRREFEGKIDDEIVAQLRRSRFVVADFTGHRYGVYWEAGFGAGLGLPVFFTCRKDDMDKLHFDIRQFNCIDWQMHDELRDRLARRIEAVIGRGRVGGSTLG